MPPDRKNPAAQVRQVLARHTAQFGVRLSHPAQTVLLVGEQGTSVTGKGAAHVLQAEVVRKGGSQSVFVGVVLVK